MTHAVLTARNTSGFLLWDSATSNFDVANSGNKTDLVKAFVEECRRQGLAPGLYYCLWGGEACSVTGKREIPEARALILAQLHELATCFGPISYFWIHMKNWGARRPQYAGDLRLTEERSSQNGCGLQSAHPGQQSSQVLPDRRNQWRNGPSSGRRTRNASQGGRYHYYLPFEFEPCSQSRNGGPRGIYGDYCWFTYGEGRDFTSSKSFPAEFLCKHIRQARDRGAGNVLLSCAPDHTGRFRREDVQQLFSLTRMMKAPAQVMEPDDFRR